MVNDIIKPERNYQVDNIRAILILLVVFAHFLQIAPREESMVFRGIWIAIYSFHMPAFSFFAGMFSICDVNKNGKSVISLLTLYILMYALVIAMKDYCDIPTNFSVFQPTFATWFLLVLAIHRILLPILKNVKHVFVISIVIALLSSCIKGCNDYLSIGRVFSLLPFFLGGYLCGVRGRVSRIHELELPIKIIISAMSLCLCSLFTFAMLKFDLSLEIVWAKKAYELYGMSDLEGIVMRASFFAVAFSMIATLMIVVPKRKTKWGYIGKNSLSIYILHVIPFYLIFKYELMPESPESGGAFSFLAALIAVIILAAPVIYNIVDSIGKIVVKVLWNPESVGEYEG